MNSDTARRLYNRFNIKKACSFLFVKYSRIALNFNHVVLFGSIVLVYRYR